MVTEYLWFWYLLIKHETGYLSENLISVCRAFVQIWFLSLTKGICLSLSFFFWILAHDEKVGSKLQRQIKDKQWPNNKMYPKASLSHTQKGPTALCLTCGAYKQETGCLSSPGSVNILNTNKFFWSERGETHTIRAAALSLHLSLWCPLERADNEGSLHLNSFNWSVDVTGCWYQILWLDEEKFCPVSFIKSHTSPDRSQ